MMALRSSWLSREVLVKCLKRRIGVAYLHSIYTHLKSQSAENVIVASTTKTVRKGRFVFDNLKTTYLYLRFSRMIVVVKNVDYSMCPEGRSLASPTLLV